MPDTPDLPEQQPPAHDPETAPGDGRARLLAALRRPSRGQLGVAVLLALLGFAAVTQVRITELDDTYEGRREEDLIEILNGLTGTSDRARREIERLEQARADLQSDSRARRAAIEQAEERLETLNVLAGLVPVTGPGVRVTVTGGPDGIRSDTLLDMVQELRTAGAEAIEFDGQVRVAVQSSFRQTDEGIEVDGVLLTTPVVIEAVGESRTLHDGLRFPDGPITAVDKQGGEVDVEELDALDIETVRNLPRAEYAEADEPQ